MDGVGTCIPLCTGSPDNGMCPQGFNCSISNDGSLILCVYSCNPVLQDCEPEGTGCFWDGALFNCDPAGDIPTNEPCAYINDCLPGHVCVDAASLPGCVKRISIAYSPASRRVRLTSRSAHSAFPIRPPGAGIVSAPAAGPAARP